MCFLSQWSFMNKKFTQFLYGLGVFLGGVMMSELLHWRSLGDLIAYIGLIYIAMILYRTVWVTKSISSIRQLLNSDAKQGSSVESAAPPSKVLATALLFFVPAIIHLLLFGILSSLDPCNGNSGCMAGSLSGFFLVLFTLPTLLLLLLFTLVQIASISQNYRKYLKINISLSILPFLVAFLILSGASVFS